MPELEAWRVARDLHMLSALTRRVLEEDLLRGASFVQTSILKWLDAAGPRRAQDVARFLSASAPAATQMLARLKREGLIRVRPDPEDGRAEILTLTARARARVREYEKAKRHRLEVLLRALPKSRRRDMVRGLEAAIDLLLLEASGVSDLCLHCGVYASPACVMRQHGYRCPTERDGGASCGVPAPPVKAPASRR